MLFKCRFRYEPESENVTIDAEHTHAAVLAFAESRFPYLNGSDDLEYEGWKDDYHVIITYPTGKTAIYTVKAERVTRYTVDKLKEE